MWIKQLVLGVEFLHAIFIVHMDLKPENLLITFCGNLKICDFDISEIMPSDEGEIDYEHRFLLAPNSLFDYIPPDFLMTYKLSFKFDVWSIGAFIYEFITADTAHNLKHIFVIDKYKCTTFLRIAESLDYFLESNPTMRTFLSKCLAYHAKDRISLAELKYSIYDLKIFEIK